MKKIIGYGLIGLASCKVKKEFKEPFKFESQADFDFPETKSETEGGWSLKTRCGQEAVAGSDKDQRKGEDESFFSNLRCFFRIRNPGPTYNWTFTNS